MKTGGKTSDDLEAWTVWKLLDLMMDRLGLGIVRVCQLWGGRREFEMENQRVMQLMQLENLWGGSVKRRYRQIVVK